MIWNILKGKTLNFDFFNFETKLCLFSTLKLTILIKITLDKDMNIDSRNDSVFTIINQAKKQRNSQYYDKSIELHK